MAGEQHVQESVWLEAEEAPDSEFMVALCVQREVCWGSVNQFKSHSDQTRLLIFFLEKKKMISHAGNKKWCAPDHWQNNASQLGSKRD